MIGKTISHYKILDKLGEGGMGVVYLGEDTKLERKVAIKFLPHHISNDSEEKARFEIEAKAAASLNHPNITTIHSIEEANDNIFIVMEYVDGIELKDKIKSLSLSTEEAIKIAIQIAEGLEAAHNKGIIHRDIKSQNIMITSDGKVKIMDFGLAKIGQGMQVTKIGSTVGTIAYMSPEQARGEELDQRTDVWSLGVVLYEMLTGELPFKGDYDQAVIYSILNEEIQSASQLNPNAPMRFEEIIRKCLEKNKEERYENMDELIENIKKINTKSDLTDFEKIPVLQNYTSKKKTYFIYGISVLVILLAAFFLFNEFAVNEEADANINSLKRLAVLPFTNIKNDIENNYLGFALADQIIGSLSYVKNILVRPSSSIRKYENKEITLSEIGKELKVDYILAGNYLKESGIVRLNLEMVDLRSNEIIWRKDFDVEYKNTFKLQDIVSEKVVSGLKVEFTNGEKNIDVPHDPLAYEYYLKAVSYPLNIESNRIAVNILKKAIELDSTYAPVYSELGYRYQLLSSYDTESGNMLVEVEASYLKALSINKNLLAALGNLSAHYTEIGRTIEAVELTKRALEINPNNAQAHFWLGYIYRYTGLLEESAKEMETALQLDPNNPRFRTIGITYAYIGKYEEAIRGFELDKETALSNSWIGVVYFRMNKIEQSKKYLNKAINLDPTGVIGLSAKALLEYINGNKVNGLKSFKKLVSTTYDGEGFYNYAKLYGLYGAKKECLRVLRKAIDAGFYCYPLFLNDDFLNSVRDDPEFQELLELTKKKSDSFRKKISELL